MAKHCNSPHSPNHLVCCFSYYPGSQDNLATSGEDLHILVPWKGTWVNQEWRSNGAKVILRGKTHLWPSQQDEHVAPWLALNAIDLTCLQTDASLWAWIPLPWKSRCGLFQAVCTPAHLCIGKFKVRSGLHCPGCKKMLYTDPWSMIVGDTWSIPALLCRFT